MQAFLAAHDKKDLEAEEKLVDWDDVTDHSREHFAREELQSGLGVKITSAKIEDIPGLSPNFVARYNILPEKFFVAVYHDPRGVITMKYPIGKKEGRYYFAMFGITPEAMQRNVKRLSKNNK